MIWHAIGMLLMVAAPTPPCSGPIGGRLIPAEFVGNRIFALWHVNGAGAVRLYTDTGGITSLYPSAVTRIGIRPDTVRWKNGGMMISASVPRAASDSAFPAIPSPDSAHSWFIVQTDPAPIDESGVTWDGRLGVGWFADRVWTLDYPDRHFYFNGSGPAGPAADKCWVPLGFQVDSAGHRSNVFPRITARIVGQDVQFLLDTGARTQLTDAAWKLIDPGQPQHRATSFVVQSRFDTWRHDHPDWLVVPRAEAGSDNSAMIRVPVVQIGDTKVGPVWFTVRPDRAYRAAIDPVMDEPVDGSLGGSLWQYVTVVLDYPRARVALLSPTHR
jgi:hypothetical protein